MKLPRILILTIRAAVIAAALICFAPGDICPAPPALFDNIDYADFQRRYSDADVESLVSDAWQAIRRERYDSAAAFYSVAASRYSDALSDKDRYRVAMSHVNMGYIWLAWRMNGAEAYPWLMKAKKIADANGYRDISTAVTSNIGQIYFDYGNVPRATDYLTEAFSGVSDDRSDHYYARALMDLLTLSLYSGQDSLTDSIARIAGAYRLPADAPMGKYKPSLVEALTLRADGRPAEGASLLERAVGLLDLETDRQRYIAMHYANTAELWMDAGRYADAARCLARSVDIANECGYFNLAERGYERLVECYRRSGDTVALREAEFRALSLRDSLFNASRFEAVKDLETADRINTLNENVKEAHIAAEKQRARLAWVSVVTILLVALLVALVVSHRRLGRAYREIFKRNMELSAIPSTAAERDGASAAKNDAPEATASDGQTPDTGDDVKSLELLDRVKGIMDTSREIFNPDFSVDRLAEMLSTRPKTVSAAINRYSDSNFNSMLARYRIREACRLLADPETLRSATMESVAESVGYRSRTYFSKVFKDITGLTPLQFARQAKELES